MSSNSAHQLLWQRRRLQALYQQRKPQLLHAWQQQQAFFSSQNGDDEKPGLMQKLWGLRGGSKEKDRKADSNAAAKDSNGDANNSETAALVPAGPERKHHKLFVVELNRKPLFPGIYLPVMIQKNEKLLREVSEMRKQGMQPYVGAFLKKPETTGTGTGAAAAGSSTESIITAAADATSISGDASVTASIGTAADHLYEMGTFAQVHTVLPGDSPDSAQLLLLGHRRIRRKHVISTDPLRVYVEHLKDEAYDKDDNIKATSMELVNTMRDLLHLNPLYGEQFRTLLSLTGSIDLQDMSRLVDAAASLTSADDVTLQEVLEQLSVPDRARLVLMLLKKEVELCKLQANIREQVESKIAKEQRRMLLMEQLKSIKRELGMEKDDKSALVQRFTERWESRKAGASEEVKKVVTDELEKLGGLEPVSPEFNVTRNYLEWLTSLPWGVHSPDIFDLAHAKQVLDEDHYGLDDVKERILEFIAVSGLRGSAQGKILCLVGPPGVGKTSIGRSIARTLHRKYYRFSVGGLHDVAEIKGHRRTYVGAMPGKMVQCLKATQTSNPLLLIDEIDKLGRGHNGDPASALLELLDPEQNAAFMDHYLDVAVDLSKVLFVCTANVLDTIPGPLLDRMEVIRLSGYASDEKVAIARKYLEPQAATDAGVPTAAAHITDEAMDCLINEYCREAGVRNLKKHLEKIYRKIALKIFKVAGPPPAQPQAPALATASTDSETGSATHVTDTTNNTQASDSSSNSSSSSSSEQGSTTNDMPSTSNAKEATSTSETHKDSSTGAHQEPTALQEASKPPRVVYQGEVIKVTKEDLKEYVGQAPFAKDRFYESTPPGVVMGLAWTAMGGATLYVEAAKIADSDHKGGMTTTGQLGDVFRESVTIAHTYARAFLQQQDASNKFFSTNSVHVHVPQGATPKDGPSAGCTIITALLSLALNRPATPDMAMTGEVTLTGRVLPIGGVKEKLLAARRAGVKQIIFPEGNRADYEELSDDLKADVTPHFVSHYDEIFKLALQQDTREKLETDAVDAKGPVVPTLYGGGHC